MIIAKQPKLISIVSGKGGVGKSMLSANIAYQLAATSKKVLLIDADIMCPNQHLLFGCDPNLRLDDWFYKRTTALRTIYNIGANNSSNSTAITNNFNISTNTNNNSSNNSNNSNSSNSNLGLIAGSVNNNNLELYSKISFLDLYQELLLNTEYDYILFDTAAGVSKNLLECCSFSDEIILIVTDEPTSIFDGYGLVKILCELGVEKKIKLILNNIIDNEDADDIGYKFNMAAEHFLGIKLDILGMVPYNRAVRQSVLRQEILSVILPGIDVVEAIKSIIKTF